MERTTRKPAERAPRPWQRRAFIALAAGYAPLAVASIVLHRPLLSALAAFVLVTLILWGGLVAGRRIAWILWLAASTGGAALAWHGHAALGFLLLPVAINAAIAWLFGSTLAPGDEPLVARAIAAIEGEERLAAPGVASYARGLTLAWCLLLGAQALVLAAGAVLAVPDGALAVAGVASPWPLPRNLVLAYGHLGSYLVVGAFFALEYLWRRWHLRHLPHPGAREFFHNLARHWPRLVHGRRRDR